MPYHSLTLTTSAFAQLGTVKSFQKISSTTGGFSPVDITLADSDNFGSVANVGDLDNDGVNDLAVGAHLDDDGGTIAARFGCCL